MPWGASRAGLSCLGTAHVLAPPAPAMHLAVGCAACNSRLGGGAHLPVRVPAVALALEAPVVHQVDGAGCLPAAHSGEGRARRVVGRRQQRHQLVLPRRSRTGGRLRQGKVEGT
jgi:hypothetical protein